MSIRVLSIIRKKLVLIIQRLDIYKDGKLIKHNKIRLPFKKFKASYDKPLVKLYDKEIIEGHIDKSTGKWIYNLSFKIGEYSANLRFEGETKGWKGKTPATPGGDWWAVILPRAKVRGILKINNKEIKVKGIGYHDHNWDVKGSAFLKNLGWFWGKINTKDYTITWATIFKNIDIGQSLLVINKKNGGYINIKPKHINFIGKDLQINNNKLIPRKFIIQVKNNKVDLDFLMKEQDIHHDKMMLKMNYWRYHLMCKGKIKINSKKENISSIQITELLRFK